LPAGLRAAIQGLYDQPSNHLLAVWKVRLLFPHHVTSNDSRLIRICMSAIDIHSFELQFSGGAGVEVSAKAFDAHGDVLAMPRSPR
jgi:hypothetical protein